MTNGNENRGGGGVAEYLAIYDQWLADADAENDGAWVERLAAAAIRHGLPIYENGVDDAGAGGWMNLVMRYMGGTNGTNETNKNRAEYRPRPLPWAAGAGR